MPMNCAVASCTMHHGKAKANNCYVGYFGFPKDQSLCKEWIAKCGRAVKFNVSTSRVCSLHFRSADFERDLKSELLNLPPKKILKKGSIPSINLTSAQVDLEQVDGREERYESILEEENASLYTESIINKQEVGSTSLCTFSDNSEKPVNVNNDEIIRLKQIIKDLTSKNELLKEKLNSKNLEIKLLKKKHVSLTKMHYKCKNQTPKTSASSKIELKKIFGNIFTEKQLEAIVNKNQRVRWTEKEISLAFTIRYFSKRCYLYLRQQLNYPLPGISTLQKWASKVNMRQGFLESVLKLLEIAGEKMTEEQWVVVLQFDEMKVLETHEYDQKLDQVVGPHSQLQVINARGLFGNWKQPIFVDFDTKITPVLLYNAINKLHKIQYHVVACVHDCGSSNFGLLRDLGVSYEKSCITHHLTGDKIYFFADVPHLLKLIRNWILDSEFSLNGAIINKEPLEKLINLANSEISSCHKLSSEHITCEKSRRQNVALAAQLLSHNTATALKYYFKNDPVATATADFIETVNTWFDVMNSHVPKNSITSKAAYGLHLNDQNEILNRMYETILNLKCKNKRTLQVFQKGILMSINSVKNLYKDMQAKYSVQYILTNRINQDSLENLFSQLRSRGGLNDHPSPLNVLNRLRMIILGKPTHSQGNLNTIDKGNDEYLVGKVLLDIEYQNHEHHDYSSSSSLTEMSEEFAKDQISFETSENITENDGLEYLAGWIAYKLKGTHPDLANFTYKLSNEHNYGVPSWVKCLSFGGLLQPTEQFKNTITSFNLTFQKLMGDGISSSKKINKKLFNKFVEMHPEADVTVLRTVIRQRIFIRINYLNFKYNQQKQCQHLKKRVSEIKNKISKKIRKVTT